MLFSLYSQSAENYCILCLRFGVSLCNGTYHNIVQWSLYLSVVGFKDIDCVLLTFICLEQHMG